MPALGNALDFAKYEGRNLRAHQLGTAPSSPVTGQLYYNTADNTLYWWDGTTWQSAKGGAPGGAAGGDLSGTYPNPQIAAGVIVNADINAAAAIALSKLATDPLARANHTGTQLAATISDFNAARDAQRLDQHVNPIGPVSLAGQRITGLADPTGATDATNKNYVDQVAQGLDAKPSVRAATTGSNITLSGTQTIDGVALIAGDRVLVKDQAVPGGNGIYVVGATGWLRAEDMSAWTEVPSAYTWVEEGTTLKDTGWLCIADQGGTIGTTAIDWVQFSGAGQITAGAGIFKTGNTLDVGAGAGITVNANDVQVANNGITNAMIADGAINLATADVTGLLPVTQGGTGNSNAPLARGALGAAGYYSSATHGAGTTITITQATHGLRATRGIQVQVQDEATGAVEIPDIVVAANGDVTVTYGAALTANTKRVTLVG